MNDKQTLFETLRNMGVVLQPRILSDMFNPNDADYGDHCPAGVTSALGYGGLTFLFNADGKLTHTNDCDGVDNLTDPVDEHRDSFIPDFDGWSERLDAQIAAAQPVCPSFKQPSPPPPAADPAMPQQAAQQADGVPMMPSACPE